MGLQSIFPTPRQTAEAVQFLNELVGVPGAVDYRCKLLCGVQALASGQPEHPLPHPSGFVERWEEPALFPAIHHEVAVGGGDTAFNGLNAHWVQRPIVTSGY